MKKYELTIIQIAIHVVLIVVLITSNYFALYYNESYIQFLNMLVFNAEHYWVLCKDFVLDSIRWLVTREYDFTLSSREMASVIIYALILLMAVVNDLNSRKIIRSFKKLMRAAWGLIGIYVGISLYMLLSITILYNLKYWEFYMTKDSVFWIISYFALLMKFPAMINKEKWVRGMLLEGVRAAVLVEFIVASYTLPLIWEIIILTILLIINVLDVVPNNPIPTRTINWINVVAGLLIIVVAFTSFISDLRILEIVKTVKQFALPFILSIAFVPCSVYISLMMAYDHIFCRLDLNKRRSWMFIMYLKFRVISYCRFDSAKIYDFWRSKNYILLNAENREQLDEAFN